MPIIQGPVGPRGPAGPQGPKGDKGDPGDNEASSATIVFTDIIPTIANTEENVIYFVYDSLNPVFSPTT